MREISLSIDKSCVSKSSEITDEYIKRWSNILVSKLNIKVVLKDIENDLASFIYDERDSAREIHHGIKPNVGEYNDFRQKYELVGVEVAKLAIDAFNRLISFARNSKGQYWLTEKAFDKKYLTNLNNQFQAKANIDNGEWFDWCPSNLGYMKLNIRGGEAAIKRDEWPTISEFVTSRRRPNLVFELIANSRQLFEGGYMRSSVIEAVIALEVSVSNFGGNTNIDKLPEIANAERIDIDSIGNQIKHLGFSGSISYLIPLLFSDDVLPNAVLSKCYKALDVRNNVVHQGQRNVSPSLVREIIKDVTTFCQILDAHTNK